ncbi:thiol reductant ABC exporter subunit CydD [Luethyella okanaganae]|uniref:Thiol reductant ABC exporter subunit CydD n=1 Tax=Luethyella okanaganae TaxID=69372 RepID=A0ABW1VFL2_9MICO
MRPIDPRLLRRASAMRGFLAGGALLGLLQTIAVIAFAWLVSQLVTRGIAGTPPAELAPLFAALSAVVIVRALTIWALDAAAMSGAARVKSQLRALMLDAVARLGPSWMRGRSTTSVATVIGTGLDALDGYFAKYLPQLILTAVATPVLVAVMFWWDPLSGVIVIIALPLIPVFMVLIGWATQAVQQRQWQTLHRLSNGYLDVVGGLSTLKIFGRQHRQLERIRAVTDEYRAETMKVLRISFLSGFVLELAGSLSVALVAVSVGLRLLDGQLSLAVGLFVLLLAPEAFLPVRNVGTQFHAAADGVAAAEEVFEILDAADVASTAPAHSRPSSPEPPSHGQPSPGRRGADALRLHGLSIRHGERLVVEGLSATFPAGRLSVVSGPSGAGKSTLLAALLGFVAYDGEIRLGGVEVANLGRDWLAWCGQDPALSAGSVADNIALGSRSRDEVLVERVLRQAAADEIAAGTPLGVGGSGVSGGQGQRIAIARALYRLHERGCPVLALDEPTSALDEVNEARVIATLREIAGAGTVVIVVSHRPAVIAAADEVLEIAEVMHA